MTAALLIGLASTGTLQASEGDDWEALREVKPKTETIVQLKDGASLRGNIARVESDRLFFLDRNRALSNDERKVVLDSVAKGRSAVIYRDRRIDFGSLVNEIPKDWVVSIHRIHRSGILGAIIGTSAGTFAGGISAVYIGLPAHCDKSCAARGVLAPMALVGMPILGGWLGWRADATPEPVLIYERSAESLPFAGFELGDEGLWRGLENAELGAYISRMQVYSSSGIHAGPFPGQAPGSLDTDGLVRATRLSPTGRIETGRW